MTVYRDDERARSTARQLMILPLIPLNHIQSIFDRIVNTSPDVMKPLVHYFEGYWIRKNALEFRTNNFVEGKDFQFFQRIHLFSLGWNHHFNRLVGKFHPNV